MDKKKASATVETLFILPYVILFLMSVVWLIDLYTIHAIVGGTVNEVGNQLVTASYPYNYLLHKGFTDENKRKMANVVSSFIYSEGYLREKIRVCEAGEKIDYISVLQSIDENGSEISLKVSYFVKPYISIPGIKGIFLTNSFYSKAYVGYEGRCPEDGNETVYITANSEVYHTSTDCKALKTTIKRTSINQVDRLRNKSDGKYYECSKCCKNKAGNDVYITPYGTRYHMDANCSDLNVTLYEVSVHEAEERRLCKFCQNQ